MIQGLGVDGAGTNPGVGGTGAGVSGTGASDHAAGLVSAGELLGYNLSKRSLHSCEWRVVPLSQPEQLFANPCSRSLRK